MWRVWRLLFRATPTGCAKFLEMQSEIHGLKTVRETLTIDFEHRTRQVHRLESELEKANHREKGDVPVQV